ncbi:MAG: hypothetical protein QOI21_3317 [Actinomycetota bacterium]|nr:hypothetical protein [Actinomycetota bacterium]
MLPNHRPLVVAEQFGVLESLFPGRIDMGLGRSVGFTEGIRRALGHGKEAASDFGAQVTQLLGYFSGEQQKYPGVHAIPAEGLRVPAFLPATGSGASLAAELGLPLVIANVRGEWSMLDAIGGYRDNFRPSAISPAPYVVLSSAVAVAETTDKAWRLLGFRSLVDDVLPNPRRIPAAPGAGDSALAGRSSAPPAKSSERSAGWWTVPAPTRSW